MSKKQNIAVFFGGVSPEHDISIITAIMAVIKPLELSSEYTVVPVYISKEGKWYTGAAFAQIATYRSGKIDEFLDDKKPLQILFDNGLTLVTQGLRKRKIQIDIAFPAMHGGHGEDGSLMGLLRMAGIPFVGCDMPASVIAMDKLLAKQLSEANDVPVTKYVAVRGGEFAKNPAPIVKKIESSLTYPVFIKPVHLGSSIGISRAKNSDELRNGIEVAAYYDDKIVVEQAVANLIEVTVPIIGNDVLEVGLVEKPLVTEGNVFDFDTKYLKGGKKGSGATKGSAQGYSELPAKIPQMLYDAAVATAKKVYEVTECSGIARIDLLIDSKTDKIYFNEINPLPGSLYSHNWRKAGVSNIKLVDKLIKLALERHSENAKKESTFSTNFLKQF